MAWLCQAGKSKASSAPSPALKHFPVISTALCWVIMKRNLYQTLYSGEIVQSEQNQVTTWQEHVILWQERTLAKILVYFIFLYHSRLRAEPSGSNIQIRKKQELQPCCILSPKKGHQQPQPPRGLAPFSHLTPKGHHPGSWAQKLHAQARFLKTKAKPRKQPWILFKKENDKLYDKQPQALQNQKAFAVAVI